MQYLIQSNEPLQMLNMLNINPAFTLIQSDSITQIWVLFRYLETSVDFWIHLPSNYFCLQSESLFPPLYNVKIINTAYKHVLSWSGFEKYEIQKSLYGQHNPNIKFIWSQSKIPHLIKWKRQKNPGSLSSNKAKFQTDFNFYV